MKVLKFEEFINEGLWGNTILRSKDGNVRKEYMFDESDLDVFGEIVNGKKHSYYKKSKIKIEHTHVEFGKLRDKILEKYEKIVLDFANGHGLLKCGFLKDDELVVPDFEYSYVVECEGKRFTIYFNYIAETKDIEVFCGNNKKEYDISNREYGFQLKKVLYNILDYIIYDKKDIIYKNLKDNFELFKKKYTDWLFDKMTDRFDIEMESDDKLLDFDYFKDFDDWEDDRNTILGRFYFDGIYYEKYNSDPKVFIYEEQDITDTPEAKEILKIFKDTYEDSYKYAYDKLKDRREYDDY